MPSRTGLGLVLLVLTTASLPTQAGPCRLDGRLVHEDKPWCARSEGLDLWLVVSTKPGHEIVRLFDECEPCETPIRITRTVRRNESFTVLVLFSNCRPDGSGKCKLTASYTVLTPDGKVLDERDDLPVWQEDPPREDDTELGMTLIQNIAFDVEPVGTYEIRFDVKDAVTGRTVSLRHPLELVEPGD